MLLLSPFGVIKIILKIDSPGNRCCLLGSIGGDSLLWKPLCYL